MNIDNVEINELDESDQAIQINENTIADPEQPEPTEGDEELHGRRDFPMKDHGMQINDNTVGNKQQGS